MRDVKSRDSSIIIDNSRNYIYNNSSTHYAHAQTEVKKKETTIKEILKKSAIQCLSSIIATLVSGVIAFFTKKGGYTYNDTPMIIICVLLAIALISSVIMAIGFLSDLFKCFSLKKVGKFVEMRSRSGMLNSFIYFVQSLFSKGDPALTKHIVGKVYKNIDGKIYEIISKPCPFCETQPIGTMYLTYKNNSQKYVWVCNEQPTHHEKFDFKKNF